MSGVMYPVDSFEDPMYTSLVNMGIAEVSHEDYEVLAGSDPETVQAYFDAAVEDPESYPWESIIYTLKEALGGGEGAAEEGAEAAGEEGEYYYEEGQYEEGAEEGAEGYYEEGVEGAEGEDGPREAGDVEEREEEEGDGEGNWACTRCTFNNKNADATLCAVCRVSRTCEEDPGVGFLDKNADGKYVVILSSHMVPNNRYLVGSFRVTKYNPESIINVGLKKERIWEIDYFTKEFKNYDLKGKCTLTLPAANWYRLERHLDNCKSLRLMFFKTQHPYDLLFPSSEKRQRFIEMAALQRKNAVVWAPSFCRANAKEVTVKIDGTTLDFNGQKKPVNGTASFTASRMPYELSRVWVGTLNLQNRQLPLVSPKFEEYLPLEHDLYFIGLQDVPLGLMKDGKQIGEFFSDYFGESHYLLLNTASENNTFAGIEERRMSGERQPPAALVVMVRRTLLSKVGNIDYIDIMDGKKKDEKKKDEVVDQYGVFACLRLGENTIGAMMMNVSANCESIMQRNEKVQSMLAKVKCGDPEVDISVRFDYVFIMGALTYPTVPKDALHEQIAGQMILTEYQESVDLQDMCLADRVMFWFRPRSSKATVLQYSTHPHLGMPNLFALFDLFVQRPYTYAICPEVPIVKVAINSIKFLVDTLPTIRDAEVRINGEWFEDAPIRIPLKFNAGKYFTDGVKPLQPVTPAYEFLRGQSVVFTLFGQAEGVTEKKGMIASSVIPLRDMLIPDQPQMHSCFVLRLTTVIGIVEASVTYVTRK